MEEITGGDGWKRNTNRMYAGYFLKKTEFSGST